MTPTRSPLATAHVHDASCILRVALVCVHVAHDLRPALVLWRDREDATIGIACGRADHDTENLDEWGMAHLFHFTAADPSMGIAHTLAAGESVHRSDAHAPWETRSAR